MYKRTQRILPKKKGRYHHGQRTDEEIENMICTWTDDNSDLTASVLQLMLDEHFGEDRNYHTPGLSTINRILHRNGFTYKIMSNRPAAYNSTSTKHERWCYVHGEN